jgi:hypothetical protein
MVRLKNFIVSCLILLLAASQIQAQEALTPYVPVEGQIDSADAEQTWNFSGIEGWVVSVYVQSTGDGLDPEVALANSAGETLTYNDDIAYPGSTDALLQAVTLPRTDTYTVTVSGYKETTGGYTLMLLRGYSEILMAENFNGDTTTWRGSSDDLALDIAAGQLTLSLSGTGLRGYALNEPEGSYTDFYADAVISLAAGRSGWMGGLTLRHTGQSYYRLAINDQGQWRMTLVTSSGEQILRDWTNHPAIVAGQESFTLGVLANDGAFDVFYNNIYVGQVVDPDLTLTEGSIGLYLETPNSAGSESQIAFDALTVTAPRQTGEVDILPNRIVSGGQALTIQELERRRVIPTGGEAALTVTESSASLSSPGVNRLLLGRGTTFEDFVLSTTVNLKAGASGVVGCGVIFGSTSDADYALAYIDQTGGYGLSPRSGDTFAPGIFGVNEGWTQGRQHLLVVRLGETVYYFVNREHVGTIQMPAVEGEIGVAAVNYETISTTCEFSDTWVWRLAS